MFLDSCVVSLKLPYAMGLIMHNLYLLTPSYVIMSDFDENIFTYICVYIYIRIHIYAYLRICILTYVYVYVHKNLLKCIYVYIYTYECM